MKPVLEFVRQLNQQSITLRSEWLDRLQHVEAPSGEVSVRPEIEFSRASALKVSDSREHVPPVTVVRPAGLSGSRSNSWAETPARAPGRQGENWTESFSQVVNPGYSLRELLGAELHVSAGASLQTVMDGLPDSTRIAAPHPETQNQAPQRRERIDVAHSRKDTLHMHVHDGEVLKEAVLLNQTTVAKSHPGSLFRFDMQKGAALMDKPAPEIVIPASSPPDVDRVGQKPGSGSQAIDRIADQILARFPVTAPTSIVFCSFQPEVDVDSVSARLATCLAVRNIGKILLVDANGESGELSKIMGTSKLPGLTELVAGSGSTGKLVGTTDNRNLDFLPWGRGELTLRKLDLANATRINGELKQDYRYTILCSRALPDPVSRLWCEVADAVYLLVDLETIDREDLERKVQQLRAHAIRIAGFITVEDA